MLRILTSALPVLQHSMTQIGSLRSDACKADLVSAHQCGVITADMIIRHGRRVKNTCSDDVQDNKRSSHEQSAMLCLLHSRASVSPMLAVSLAV